MEPKVTVGQRLVLKPIGNAARRNTELHYGEVVNVRRKYFAVRMEDWNREIDFHLDSMTNNNNGNYISDWRAYFSEQEIADENEAIEIAKRLSDCFRYGARGLTLDQLRRIESITGES